jgi:glutamyl-Q tRNA(Asp) synthetase
VTRPVFRFAPSPNGLLHLGHALSALLNREGAAACDGRLLLRIEDIDPTRTTSGFEQAIFDDLAWLGLDWERPVRRQSEHLAEYAARLDRLRERGLAYPCFCSRGEVRAAVAGRGAAWPRDPDGAPLYPGTCRNLALAERVRRLAQGEPHVWRLDIGRACSEVGGELHWRESNGAGDVQAVPAAPQAWGDVVLARRDVATSYHLSVVHDDAAQGITHVVRGRDLYFATAVHRLLQELFGLPAPLYRHHRLITGADGAKLSKSAAARSLRALRESGWSAADVRRAVGLS